MFNVKHFSVLILLITTFAVVGEAEDQPAGNTNGFQAFRVAHAGGGLGKRTYTNSYQALDANINLGFKYFELDFSFTSDKQLVCIHDWKDNFKRTFGFETDRRLSLREFQNLVDGNSTFTNCTLAGLAAWMLNNPTAYVVTDLRGDNLKALAMIRDVLPDAINRVIPQIYAPDNYRQVKQMGFRQVIWTLYRYPGSSYKVIEWVEGWDGAIAVTMPKTRARSTLPKALKSRGIPTYVHTVNTVREMQQFMGGFGVTEIYTDFLQP